MQDMASIFQIYMKETQTRVVMEEREGEGVHAQLEQDFVSISWLYSIGAVITRHCSCRRYLRCCRRLLGCRSGMYRPGLVVVSQDQCESWSSRKHPSHLQTHGVWKNDFQAIKSNLYNPVTVPLAESQIKKLPPTLSLGQVLSAQWLQIWSQEEDAPTVSSCYSLVPKGSVLSYQCPATQAVCRVAPAKPTPLTLPQLPPYTLACSQLDHVSSLRVTEEETREYQAYTREQGQCPERYKLRKCLTDSNYKHVTGRCSNHQKLALDLFI